MLKILFTLALCCSVLASSQSIETKQIEAQAGLSVYRIRYVNSNYGYSFKIPKGFRGTCTSPPTPQHGLTINLTKSPDRPRRIVAFAYYDATYLLSLGNAVKAFLQQWQDDKTFKLLEKRHGVVAGLPAIKLQLQFTDNEVIKYVDHFIVFRKRRDSRVIYGFELVTTRQRLLADRQIFNRVLRSWRFHPIS
jgi:hypothetical protein